MKPDLKRPVLLLALAAAGALFSGVADADPRAGEAVAAFRHELPNLLIEEPDLALPTGASKLEQTLPSVEVFYSSPLAFPTAASTWSDSVESAKDLGPLFVLADSLLGGSPAVDPAKLDWEPPEPVPPSARASIKRLCAAIAAAVPYLDRAVASVTPEDRAAFAELFDWPSDGKQMPEEISSRRMHRRIDGLKKFKSAEMRTAGGTVLMAVDSALAELRDTTYYVPKPIRFPSPIGDIVIGGNGPDIYTNHDIENAAIVIDFGGRNTYVGPVGFAGPGEIRVVIDLGTSVDVHCNDHHPGSAGASLFGIAVMAMPNDTGVKRMNTGPWSQGATVGGVAACMVAGRTDATAGKYSQGSAVQGIGLFTAEGAEQSSYVSGGYGQGAGGIRGVGIFRHDGDLATVKGGLVSPDPREDQGAESLCQGVGYGPRAYSGGGIGLCLLKGDGLSVMTSYFGLGAGYWHSAGAFRLRGNHATLQGRRYTFGSGVHSAFGHFEALGDDNRILNWGVGPANGWDRAVGSCVIAGDRVEIQADYAVGSAAVGGRSFGYYAVNDGRFKTPDLGSGSFSRNESAYSIQIATGSGNRISSLGDLGPAGPARVMRDTAGLIYVASATFVDNLGLAPIDWPKVEHAVERERQAVDLKKELASTENATGLDNVSAIADVAGAFSLDRATPREALGRLLSVPAPQARYLVEALDPAAFEQMLVLSIAIAARGSAVAEDLYRTKDALRMPLCTGLLRFARPSIAIPLLSNRAGASDPVIAATAVRALGIVTNRDTGDEPGTRAVLEALGAALKSGAKDERAIAMLSRVRFVDALGLLSTAASVGAAERLELLSAGPDDITERLGGPGAGKFMDILGRDEKENRKRIDKELKVLEKSTTAVGKILERAAKSSNAALAEAAVVASGQAGRAKDALWIEPLLSHSRGSVRQAAAIALGRLGEAGLPALRRASGSASPRTRALAAFAAGHATVASAGRILESSLSDNSPLVVMTAVAVLRNAPPALSSDLSALKKKAARRLKETTSRDLKLQLRLIP